MKNQHEHDSVSTAPFPGTEINLRSLESEVPADIDSADLELDSLRGYSDGQGVEVPVICIGNPGQSGTGFQLLADLAPAGCQILPVNLPSETWPEQVNAGHDLLHALDHAVDLLADYMGVCKLDKGILLGAEFGAAVAITFAVRHPGRVSGLILCQPLGLVEPRAAWLSWTGERRSDALRTAQAAYAVAGHRLRECLSEVGCPVLAVISKSNRLMPRRTLQHLLAKLDAGQNRLRLAAFAGRRSPLVDDPERMARVVCGFAAATLPLEQHRHAWTLKHADWPARGLNQWSCTHPECRAELALPVGENPESRN